MIYLKKEQALFNNEGMVVCDPTGYYEDGATVVCAMFHSVDEPVCSYEAKYIAYGDQVYNITDEKKLMEEIIKIDPNTLMGKTKEDINIDKMVEEIKTVDNPTPESIPKEEEIIDEKVDQISETVKTTTEIDENGNEVTTTTTTTMTEEIIPEVTQPIIDIIENPIVETPAVDVEVTTPSIIDQAVSKLKGKRKIV